MNPTVHVLVRVKDTTESWDLDLTRVPVIGELIRIGKAIYTVKVVTHTPCLEEHCARIGVSRTRQVGADDV